MSKIILTDENFDDQVSPSKKLFLVYFSAKWCGPCKFQGPIIDEMASEYANKNVQIAKVDVDENPNTSMKYNILSIPNFIFFQNGKPIKQIIGFHDKDALRKEINRLL